MTEESKNGSVCSSQVTENNFTLTEKQQNFIAECEKLFANRYTEEDADYKSILEGSIGDPPIVDPWYNKPKRNFSWAGRRDERRESFRNDHRDDRRDRYSHRRFDSEGSRRDSYRNDRRDSYRGRDDGRNRNRYQSYHRDSPY